MGGAGMLFGLLLLVLLVFERRHRATIEVKPIFRLIPVKGKTCFLCGYILTTDQSDAGRECTSHDGSIGRRC
eukprot:6720844-Pyramimonas_sp.AAC.1